MNGQDFTGERYLPGQGGYQIAYEHLHRYLFAARWADGSQVLDVAAGIGYGAALLASRARRVCCFDLDWEVVRHGRDAFARENVFFCCADAAALPFASRSMDLVLAFEVLEHLAEQAGMVSELARVTRLDGMAVISTPNRAVYTDARRYANPFHVHEFYREEFVALLRSQFPHVRLLEQHVRAGSLIQAESAGGSETEIITEPVPDERRPVVEPMYFLAQCRFRPAREPEPHASAYLDLSDGLLEEWAQKVDGALAEIFRLNEEIRKFGEWCRSLERQLAEKDATLAKVLDEVAARDQTIRQLQDEMRDQILQRDQLLRSLQAEFEERSRWAEALNEEVRARDERLKRSNQELDRVNQELRAVGERLARIRHAFLYRVLCRMGILPK